MNKTVLDLRTSTLVVDGSDSSSISLMRGTTSLKESQMSDQPAGTFPLVFESGVVSLDEEGVLHVYLSHSPDAAHPMVTHPDGEETFIPMSVFEATITGADEGPIRVLTGMREASELPDGFVFHLKGWQLCQLEVSGDFTVVFSGVEEPPDWFQPGKVHRFDGPDEGFRIFKDSLPLSKVEIPNVKPKKPKSTGVAVDPTATPLGAKYTPDRSLAQDFKKRPGFGCATLILVGIIGSMAVAGLA